ncbi:hypothetical protein CLS_12870 [[Clostridium] cf. saccharolyticum K10]|nr:hypothetical protein CLS_12870 [[Clostridium] cf. saccharolyticum K10]
MTVRCLRADKNKAGQGIILSPVRLYFISLSFLCL